MPRSRTITRNTALALFAATTTAVSPALAADLTSSASTGNVLTVPYTPAQTPANGDNLTYEGAFNVTYGPTDAASITSLSSIRLNVAGGAGTFTQNAGAGSSLTLGTLNLASPGGASRVPTYDLVSGSLNITSALQYGNGANGTGVRLFVRDGATLNYSGPSLSLASGGGARSSLILEGGTFSTTTVPNIYLTNVGVNNSGNSFLTLTNGASGTGATFSAPTSTLVLAQFNNSTTTGQANATLTLDGNSTLTVANLVLGGANAINRNNGVVNMNGGTLSTGSILFGNSSLAPSPTVNAFNANGGTIRATASGTFFSRADLSVSAYVNIGAGGLNLDTQSFTVTSAAPLHGTGALTKTGPGTLVLTGASDYTGNTTISQGTLQASGSLTSPLTLAPNTTLALGATGATSILTNTASTTLGANTSFLFDINAGTDASPTAAIDTLITAGLTLDPSATATLSFFGNAAGFQLGQVLTLVNNTSASPISGSFANLPEGSIIPFSPADGSPQLTLSYLGNDGNDLTLTVTAIPEPGAATLLLPAAALLRRRR